MTKLLKSGEISEKSIHKSIFEWISFKPEIRKFLIHCPNEGVRDIGYGKLLKSYGMRRGVFDLFFAIPRHGHHGAWIELKSKNGIMSAHQKTFMEDMRSQNYFCDVCYSIEKAIEIIEWYCFK